MKSDLHALYPTIYRDVLETGILADVGDVQYDKWFSEMDDARKNQFVLTADVRGIEAFERIYSIKADPATEDLEFRRQRLLNRMQMKIPFTFRFLLERLDTLIGPGKYNAWLGNGNWHYRLGNWNLGQHAFQDPEYTLYIETATTDVSWHHEVQVFVAKIKPANMVYILSPMLGQGFLMSESVGTYPRIWNYHLGSWRLGNPPFLSDGESQSAGWYYRLGTIWRLGAQPFGIEPAMEVVKMPETASILPAFLNEHAQTSAGKVAAVRLNGTYLVEDLQKVADGSTTTLRYTVTPMSGLREITSIELLWEDGEVLSCSAVYIPVPAADQITMKHTITHKEGTTNG